MCLSFVIQNSAKIKKTSVKPNVEMFTKCIMFCADNLGVLIVLFIYFVNGFSSFPDGIYLYVYNVSIDTMHSLPTSPLFSINIYPWNVSDHSWHLDMLIAYEHMRTTHVHAHVRTYIHVYVCARTHKNKIFTNAHFVRGLHVVLKDKHVVWFYIFEKLIEILVDWGATRFNVLGSIALFLHIHVHVMRPFLMSFH